MRRRTIKIAGIAIVTIGVVVTAGWFFFVQQARQALTQWADAQRQEGVDVTWQSLDFNGYPFRVNTQIGDPQIVVRRPDHSAIWIPANLAFRFSAFAPQAIAFAGPGAHNLRIEHGGDSWSAMIEADRFNGQALFPPRDYRQLESLTGKFSGVRITPLDGPGPIIIDKGTFAAIHPATPPVDPSAVHPLATSVEFNLDVRDIHLPEEMLQATALGTLGTLIGEISAGLQLEGVLDAGSLDSAALTTWRDDGGTLEVTSMVLQWGPVQITADGTLALDGDLQPVGSFATRIAGLGDVITALETDGVISSNDATVARLTIAILAKDPSSGGPTEVEIPLTLQERILRLGPIALTQLPTVTWD